MTLSEFKAALAASPECTLLFVFDDGETVPPDFHITEVGYVVKKFIDCGGTKRSAEACVLQAWVAANDPTHRLTAGKLAKIVDLGQSLFPSDSLAMELEYEQCVLSHYRIKGCEIQNGHLQFALEDKHTDCLAKEACGLSSCGSSAELAHQRSGAKCC